jgi:hypothetical protein
MDRSCIRPLIHISPRIRLCWCNWEYLSHLVSSTSFISLNYPMFGSGAAAKEEKKGDRRRVGSGAAAKEEKRG